MDLRNLGIFKLLSEKMAYGAERQRVLAQNLANSDTPNYKPRDLAAFDFRRQLQGSFRTELAQTAAGHFPGGETVSKFDAKRDKSPYETAPNGNQVVLEEQMLKIAENQADAQLVNNIYRKQLGFMKSALGRSQ